MNRIISSVAITAAIETGTTFYEITEQQLQDYYANDKNIIIQYLIRNYGFDAFDLSRMYGSAIIGDNLYVCVTDGSYITVNGDEEINPEDALEEFDLSELSDYIQPADDEIIKRYASYYDFKNPDMNEIAIDLLNAGHDFYQIIEDAKDIDVLEDILY